MRGAVTISLVELERMRAEIERLRLDNADLAAQVERITADFVEQRRRKRLAIEKCLVLSGCIDSPTDHEMETAIRERLEAWCDELKKEALA